MTRDPRIDVVILTWNDGDDARTAVETALQSVGVEVTVTVVDNGSDVPFDLGPLDDARARVVRLPSNVGVGGGRNHGAMLGGEDYVCFLDSDAILRPHSLETLLAPILEDPTIGLVGPVFAGHERTQTGGRAPTIFRKVARGLGLTNRYAAAGTGNGPLFEVDFVIGACQLFRRAVWIEVGPLDAAHRFGPEDLDFCLRVRAAGWRIVQVPDSGCRHDARRGFRSPFTKRGIQHGLALVDHYRRVGVSGRQDGV